jgi:hypothetical protein
MHTTGRERSPRISQRSAMARNPTRKTTKTPTNLTATEPTNMAPVADSQNHQGKLKALRFKNKIKYKMHIHISISTEMR